MDFEDVHSYIKGSRIIAHVQNIKDIREATKSLCYRYRYIIIALRSRSIFLACLNKIKRAVRIESTADGCTSTLINEVFLPFRLFRKIISDWYFHFASVWMQHVCFILDIEENSTLLQRMRLRDRNVKLSFLGVIWLPVFRELVVPVLSTEE